MYKLPKKIHEPTFHISPPAVLRRQVFFARQMTCGGELACPRQPQAFFVTLKAAESRHGSFCREVPGTLCPIIIATRGGPERRGHDTLVFLSLMGCIPLGGVTESPCHRQPSKQQAPGHSMFISICHCLCSPIPYFHVFLSHPGPVAPDRREGATQQCTCGTAWSATAAVYIVAGRGAGRGWSTP